jgi:hypothetical protein
MGSRGPVRGVSLFEKFKDHFYFLFRRVIDFASLELPLPLEEGCGGVKKSKIIII